MLDIEANSHGAGAKVIMFHRKDAKADNQLWFEDHSGNIRSKLNENNVLDACGAYRILAYLRPAKYDTSEY